MIYDIALPALHDLRFKFPKAGSIKPRCDILSLPQTAKSRVLLSDDGDHIQILCSYTGAMQWRRQLLQYKDVLICLSSNINLPKSGNVSRSPENPLTRCIVALSGTVTRFLLPDRSSAIRTMPRCRFVDKICLDASAR